MPKKNQCTAITNNNKRCNGFITKTDNPGNLPICYHHLIQADRLLGDEPEFGVCCFCQGPCNPCSQACGRCVRRGTY